ncbi:hypothetical protein COU49_02615 [Candidatus Nomurabacteria bacterium CG10_big_fil_rev_8_21_14_0_10_35_16]|uniref:Uncharacterized protein n=1 Tax=Candidatus Nomurabacteria bacterium CG10_big_fil_rev_8_21_14_0_10_35_16 TaxID=1974731 RepID=A0A2H0TB40_9BACT|nr:MAG: hypothetical protein COU49_02615 [Candidatus Nomurabacteria bacterium CG10_big_fil_rev_8_21_14_0_10_35_16]
MQEKGPFFRSEQREFDLPPTNEDFSASPENHIEELRKKHKINPECKITLRDRFWYVDDYLLNEWLDEREKKIKELGLVHPEWLVKKENGAWIESKVI